MAGHLLASEAALVAFLHMRFVVALVVIIQVPSEVNCFQLQAFVEASQNKTIGGRMAQESESV